MSFEDVFWCFFRLLEFRGPKHSSNNEVEKPGNIKIIEEICRGKYLCLIAMMWMKSWERLGRAAVTISIVSWAILISG